MNFSENSDKAATLCSGQRRVKEKKNWPLNTEAMRLINQNIKKLQNNLK